MKKRSLAVLTAAMVSLLITGASCACADEAQSEAADLSEEMTIDADDAPVVDLSFDEDTIGDFIELGAYKGLKIEAAPDTPAEMGMTVNIDFTGSIDGEEFDGGSAEDFELLLGSGSFIDNFEDQLVGHKAGETVDVTVTFPEDYGSEELAGKKALFKCRINSVCYQSVDVAYAQFLDSCKVRQYPKDLVDKWSDLYLDLYSSYVDTEADASKKEILDAFGLSESYFDGIVLNAVKELMAEQAVLTAENISRESDEYQDALEQYIIKSGYDSVDDALDMGVTPEEIEHAGDMRAVMDLLIRYEAS